MTSNSELSSKITICSVWITLILVLGSSAAFGSETEDTNWRNSCSVSQTLGISNVAPGEEGIAVLDLSLELDGDGIDDQIQIRRNHNQYGRGQTSISVSLSSLTERIEFEYYYESGMIDIIPVPVALRGEDVAPARQAVVNALVGAQCEIPDTSLDWFLSDRAITWHKKLSPPTFDYVLPLPSVPAALVSIALAHHGFDAASLDQPVWLIYRAGMHEVSAESVAGEGGSENSRLPQGFSLLGISPEYKVWASGQGLVVGSLSRDAYAWIYVNDGWRGWQDMRKSAVLEKDTLTVYVSIPFDEPVTQILRANIDTGTVSETIDDMTAPPSMETARDQCQGRASEQSFMDVLYACRVLINGVPRDADARYRMGTVYEAMGLPHRALPEYRKAISIDTDHVEAAGRVKALEKAASAN